MSLKKLNGLETDAIERLKSAGRLIATVYGVGYRLEQEEPK